MLLLLMLRAMLPVASLVKVQFLQSVLLLSCYLIEQIRAIDGHLHFLKKIQSSFHVLLCCDFWLLSISTLELLDSGRTRSESHCGMVVPALSWLLVQMTVATKT